MSTVPDTMWAAAIDRFGGPEQLTPHRLPVPVPDAGEVLIALHTMGVGSWDADIRAGWTPDDMEVQFPLVLGTDGSGRVAAVGSDVRRLHESDEVYSYSWANPKGGFYAEYVAVPAERVAHVPAGLDLRHAGAIPTTGLTALQGIDDALHVRSGETVLIHGASGGVGTLAVQFAKLRGARVLASASGTNGVALTRKLGADEAFDGRHANVAQAARSFAPNGIDAILALAGEGVEQYVAVLGEGGRVAYPNGIEPEPQARCGIKIVAYDAISGVREFEELGHAVEAAKLKVPIDSEFPLQEASKAHARLARGHVLGKIVLRIS